MFCRYENINFVVCTEVYGGTVVTSIVEELHFYGVGSIIGIGFVMSIDENFAPGTNVCIYKALTETGVTSHYTLDEFISGDIILGSVPTVSRAVCWTTNSIYRENSNNIAYAKLKGCNVVNLDTTAFFAASKTLGMVYTYVGTITAGVTVITDPIQLAHQIKKSKNALFDLVIASIPMVNRFPSLKYSTSHLKTIAEVSDLFQKLNICKSHNIDHVINVYNRTTNALVHVSISPRIKFLIELAALLHDADDSKFAPSESFQNARQILQKLDLCAEDIELVIEMISYVSASTNGDTIPLRAVHFPWMLIARHADRLEAIGTNGVIRAYEYMKTTRGSLYTDQTERPESVEDVWTIATADRYAAYKGSSLSMIDHYYDKLLRVGKFPTDNPYLLAEQSNGLEPLLAVIDLFIKGTLTDEYFENLIQDE